MSDKMEYVISSELSSYSFSTHLLANGRRILFVLTAMQRKKGLTAERRVRKKSQWKDAQLWPSFSHPFPLLTASSTHSGAENETDGKWNGQEKINQNNRIWPCGFGDHSMTRYWMATAMRMEVRASSAMMRRENCSSVRLRRGCWFSAALGPALLDEPGDSTRRGSKMALELYGPMISGASWHCRIAHTRKRYSEDELKEGRRNTVSEPLYI